MYQVVLVPATGAETDAPVFATALAVARAHRAHLKFLHVRVDAQRVMISMASSDMAGGDYGGMFEQLTKEAASRQQKAEQAFRAFCATENLAVAAEPSPSVRSGGLPSAEWQMETGDEPAWLATHARVSDLVVLGREREGEPVAWDILEAAVMEAGRPVLIAAAMRGRNYPETVAIAWKNRPEAARAVFAATPMIQMAKRVIIFSVSEPTNADTEDCDRLRLSLLWHNPQVSVQHLTPGARPPAETLLEAAGVVGADILVMGGYGHSRLREVIFGGFTHRILKHAELPVLMTH